MAANILGGAKGLILGRLAVRGSRLDPAGPAFFCQPPNCDDQPEPDPEMAAQMWADKPPAGWKRCADCGEEWAIEDEPSCKCEPSVK